MQRFIRMLSEKSLEALNLASMEMASLRQNMLTPEFVLIGLLEQEDAMAMKIIAEAGFDAEDAKSDIADRIYAAQENEQKADLPNDAQIQVTVAKETEMMFDEAKRISDELGDKFIGTGSLFLAMFDDRFGPAAEILKDVGLTFSGCREAFEKIRKGQKLEERDGESRIDILSQFTVDLTEKARKGELDPVIGRESEIRRTIQILSRRKKNNPVLIGEPGVGKTVIVEGLAQMIVNADAPENLLNKRVLSLDMSAVVAGAKFRGEFEERMQAVKDAIIKAAGQIILFIDELHTVVGANQGGGGLDAADMLKPALSRGQLQCIGATTMDEYKKYIEPDKALERRFQTVKVEEPTVEQTVQILNGLKERYEAHHKITYTPEAVMSAARLSERYIADRFLPDKAVDLLDESGAKKRLQVIHVPNNIRKLERDKQSFLEQRRQAFFDGDFEVSARIQQKLLEVDESLQSARKSWADQRGDNDTVVGEEEISEIVALQTGIPVSRMQETEMEKLARMEQRLHRRIVGQDNAVAAVSNAIRRNRAGFKDKNRPIGSFIFLGPTGVGKTELAKVLAEFLFDDESRMIRLDMSEYQERHTVSRVMGSPPGYVGYDEGGQLTESVRRNPYSVILLDEIEKAHPDVFNVFLQILDDGRLTDAKGRTVSFQNTLIIGTSNIGSDLITQEKKAIGFRSSTNEAEYEDIKSVVMGEVKKAFKPEMINRLDDLIVFHPLGEGHIRQIVDLLIEKMTRRLAEEGFELEISDEVRDFVAREGFQPAYGARPLKRAIEARIENEFAQMVVKGEIKAGSKTFVEKSGEGQISFRVERSETEGEAKPE